MDDLLHVVSSDGADELKLHAGSPPIVMLGNERHAMEGPALTGKDTERLFHSIANTRQRRELRDRGAVQFVYRFRGCTDFVVSARIERGHVGMDIH